ncbi:Alkaline phosphatase synthesis sensor protein PhoR [Fundidesulfovibrio magnetotacticus]|uniref:Alkaline phosphatase synthesis sensor protein PhoR n=1 Tax=Fundidesulfovibrio magnetotacticus TaxID=2730080 RepID=A0A6V8LLF3_9BACT|nr:PAS domain-containing sensor histidine kinase [Fundidesulfovibrio magnetotacticus]GFK93513.1 Alkaline phosphatase synthesis sensor protein PhoR [Fundidesulfovibrio magnetotacticus]
MTDNLRKRAEMQLNTRKIKTDEAMTPEEMLQMMHELRVHQIELEMQNEELRRTQMELETLRAKYFDLYDLAPIGYVTLSGKGMLLETNVTFATMLGVPRGTLANQPLSRFIHKEDQDIYYKHHKLLASTGMPQGCELRMMKADATHFWAKIDAVPATEEGKATVYRTVISDISARKHAEQLQADIEGIIQHDLRSPACNAVNVAMLLLEGDGLNDQQRQLLLLLNNAGLQMLDTLDRSLDMHRIETGQYKANPKTFNCLPVILEIIQNLRNMKQHRNTSMQVLLNGAPPPENVRFACFGQEELLRASLFNLMKNAVEASPKGSMVTVNLASDKDRHIEIRNQGVVPASIRDRFFDKYSTAGKPYGTGLGTYSAKMMIEAQGGTLTMRTSEESGETVLTIHLPSCASSAGIQ